MLKSPDRFAAAKARDALVFDPLPKSPWITLDSEGIRLTVPYSEPLSRLIRTLPGRRWDAAHKAWILPYTAAPALRAVWATLHDLAAAAHASRQEEVAGWEAERKRRHAETLARREKEQLERDQAKYAREAAQTPAVLSAEYVKPRGPGVIISLESIGEDATKRGFGLALPRRCGVLQILAWSGERWLTARTPGRADYLEANSIGSRGVYYHYTLREGPIYRVTAPTSWKSNDVYFARVAAGEIVRMTEDEVRACLAS